MAAVSVVIGQYCFDFAVGNELAGLELDAIDNQLRTEVQVAVVYSHGRAICSVGFVVSPLYHDVCLAVACGIAKGDVSSFPRKACLNIDIAVVVDSHMTCATCQAVHHHHCFKSFRQKETTVVRVSCRQFRFCRALRQCGQNQDQENRRERQS